MTTFNVNSIYNIEALKSLKKMEEDSIDLAFFDPPYNVNKDYGVYKDNKPKKEYYCFMEEIIANCRRVSKRGIGIYIDWKHFKLYWHKLLPSAEPIIIYKRSSGVVESPLNIIQHHHIILTTAKAVKPNLKSLWDDIRVYGEGYLFKEETFDHPAQTSLKATKRYIEYFSKINEVVLDPFMGVGTTATACKKINRNFLGFELNKEYIQKTQKRLKRTKREKKTVERTLNHFF